MAWQAAGELHHALTNGASLQPVASRLRLPREQVYGEFVLQVARYATADVTYTRIRSNLFAPTKTALAEMAGNHVRRRRAERLAAAQWRPLGPLHTVLTDRSILYSHLGSWCRFDHGAVVELLAEPKRYEMIEFFDGAEPLRLIGPWAPWLSLATAWLLYGAEGIDPTPW